MTSPDFAVDVEELDRAVEGAIRAGEAGDLQVLGYGEITLVLAWPAMSPHLAVKRLPVFPDTGRLQRYTELLERYETALRERGVSVVPTVVRSVTDPRGRVHAYLLQPRVPDSRLLHHALRDASQRDGEALLARLVEHVMAAVDERVGLDAQAANWAIVGRRMALFDLSTPILRPDGAGGRQALDLEPFISIYPWALRRALRPVARSIMDAYHDPRHVLLDAASNLHKEELDRWVPALLEEANPRLVDQITERDVRRFFTRDRRLWLTLQRLRRADRAWQRRVRHRPYPFLLPPPYRYGPA